jgi:L-lactate dehydrogenase complex protein LldF
MNTCPVYRRSGGLSYGSTYMGPIGIIMMPTFDIRRYSELPFSSTLNGSCTNVCPVKINIHEQIYAWREVMEEKHQINLVKKSAMIVAGKVLSNPTLYRIAGDTMDASLKVLPHLRSTISSTRGGGTEIFLGRPKKLSTTGTRSIGCKQPGRR